MSVKGSVVGMSVTEAARENKAELVVDDGVAGAVADEHPCETDVSDESFQLEPVGHVANDATANAKEARTEDMPSMGSAGDEPATEICLSPDSSRIEHEDAQEDEVDDVEPAQTRLVDYMGGIDKRNGGIVVDGDEFFDTEDALIESDDESSTDDSLSILRPIEVLSRDEGGLADEESLIPEEESDVDADPPGASGLAAEDDSWVPYDEHEESGLSGSHSGLASVDSEPDSLEEEGGPSAVMLEETPLPRMFLPGKIVHIYTHRGGYKAAFVPRAFRELRRISLAGNMLSDHTTQAYYEALLEVQSVRSAPEGLPRWTAFDEDDTCSCCASRFTWASTSDSEAQEARDKHNCRSCGTLVCDPCAQRRMPLPSIGITVSVRVCDRCYNDQSGALVGRKGNALASSFLEERSVAESDARTTRSASLLKTPDQDGEEQPERQRERRSVVVDELASRIHSTVSCT